MEQDQAELTRLTKKKSAAWLLTLAILGFGCLITFSISSSYWAERDAWSTRSYYRSAIRFLHLDLTIRSVAIRRFVAKHGRLPETLEECKDELPRIKKLLKWTGESTDDQITYNQHDLSRLFPSELRYLTYIFDSESTFPFHDKPSLDLLGLPIIYQPTQGPSNDEAWLSSADPLPEGLELFLKDNGGIPAESPIQFSLSSVFLQRTFDKIHAAELKYTITNIIYTVIVLLYFIYIVFLYRRWKSYTSGRPKSLWFVFLTVITILATFLGLTPFTTCYLPGMFSANHFSREERIAMLNEAVSNGEVSDEVAKIARKYISELHKYKTD